MTFRFPGWGTVGIFAALTWFEQRWAAIPLIIYFLFALTGVAISVSSNGFSIPLAGKLVVSCCAIYELVVWYGAWDDEQEIMFTHIENDQETRRPWDQRGNSQ